MDDAEADAEDRTGIDDPQPTNGENITNRSKKRCKLYRALLQPTLPASPPSPCPATRHNPCITGCINVPARGGNSSMWRVASYEDLMTCIAKIQEQHDTADPCPGFQQLFLDKYLQLVGAACGLHKCLCDEIKGSNPQPFTEVDKHRSNITKLRIWDFVDKWRYAWLSELVQHKFSHNACSSPSVNPRDLLSYQDGKTTLPDLPGRVLHCQVASPHMLSQFELHCWIAVNTYYFRGNALTTILLLPYLLDTKTLNTQNQNDCYPSKYAIEIQLQAGYLKLMLGTTKGNPAIRSIRLRLNELDKNCCWEKDKAKPSENRLGTYRGGQKVVLLTSANASKRQDGEINYWFAQKWLIGSNSQVSGLWSNDLADVIADNMVKKCCGVLKNLAKIAVTAGNPNPDWFVLNK